MPEVVSFMEFLDGFKDGIVKDLNNPKCVNCSECCGILTPISRSEFFEIKRYFKKNKDIVKRVNTNILPLNTKTINMRCPLSINNKCVIYNIRPEICRKFHCKMELCDPDCKMDKTMMLADLFTEDRKIKE